MYISFLPLNYKRHSEETDAITDTKQSAPKLPVTEIIKLSVNTRTKTWLPSWLDTEKDVFLFASSNMHSINVTQNLNSTILLYFSVQLPLTPLSLSNARIAASSLYARLTASGNTIESGILKWREALM